MNEGLEPQLLLKKVRRLRKSSRVHQEKGHGGEVGKTAPKCCLWSWLPRFHRAPPGWLTGLCQAHLLQDTARRLILLRQTRVTGRHGEGRTGWAR